jgi:toxin ParE1/3/4
MDKRFRVEYLPIAEKDLTEIVEYILNDNTSAAVGFIDEIDKAVSKLCFFPFMGHVPKDPRLIQLNYRMLVVGNYLVFYVVLDENVEIRRIIHAKRKYDFLF